MPENNPQLSHAHFVLIADLIAQFTGWEDGAQQEEFAEYVADQIAHLNPRFDRERFLNAATPDDEDDDED